jgi:hypothetical protein
MGKPFRRSVDALHDIFGIGVFQGSRRCVILFVHTFQGSLRGVAGIVEYGATATAVIVVILLPCALSNVSTFRLFCYFDRFRACWWRSSSSGRRVAITSRDRRGWVRLRWRGGCLGGGRSRLRWGGSSRWGRGVSTWRWRGDFHFGWRGRRWTTHV